MKKTLLVLFLIFFAYMLIGNVCASNDLIPDEAIRIRVIANSNSEDDQKIKIRVKEILEQKMYEMLKDKTKINEIRKEITNNISNIENEVSKILKDKQYGFTVNYGYNYFPQKEFKGITYKEGYYESLVITLGEGKGDNWWCVLFPPLCMIEKTNSTEVEYTTLVKTIVDKYF